VANLSEKISGRPDHVDHSLERVIFFSDAVFAIAITLLVIEIEIPHLKTKSSLEAWHSLIHLIPSFGAYVLSFAVIGRFWMSHHMAFSNLDRYVPALMRPNLVMLLFIAFMPFATAYFAQNLQSVAPIQFYDMILIAIAVANARIMWMTTAVENVRKGVDETTRETMRGRSLGVILVCIITLIASIVIGNGLSQLFLILIPVGQRLGIKWRLRRIVANGEPS
jgi:uncharacterized membrane protein